MAKPDFAPVYPRHADDDWADEFRIVTIPRWKESELSGDEWRFSCRIDAYRKGVLIAQRSGGHDLQQAAIALIGSLGSIGGTHIGEGWEHIAQADGFWEEFCAQPTCTEKATLEFRLLNHYCRDGKPHDYSFEERIRFCDRHKRRGDCGLADADRNYTVVALRLPDGSWKPVEEA